MQLEDYFDFSDPREVRLKGHRVWIQHILVPYLEQGKSAEQIAQDLPTLSLDKVYATILYYLLNKEAVDEYLRDLRAEMARQRAAQPPPSADFLARMRKAKADLDERRAARQRGEHESEVPAG